MTRFEAIDTTGFPEQEVLNKELMVRDLKMDLEGARFKPWEMPVTQENGIHIDAPQLVSVLSFASVKDYEDYIARLKLDSAAVRPDHRADAQRHGRGTDAAEDAAGESCHASERNRHNRPEIKARSRILSINFLMPSPKPIASGCAKRAWLQSKIL